MKNSIKQIISDFGGKLVGTPYMQRMVAETLLFLPEDITNYLTNNVWFLSSTDDAWAYAFNGNDVRNGHFIFLSDDLLGQSINQIQFSVLHEVGHIMLKHRNSINYQQTRREIKKQEKEADEFAKKYLKDRFHNSHCLAS